MGKTTDMCFVCGRDLNNPIDGKFQKCRGCKIRLRISDFVFIAAILLIVLFKFFVYSQHLNLFNFLETLGLIFNIVGIRVLADGLLGRMILSALGWGGATETFKKCAPRQFKKELIGLYLFTFGFVLLAV